MSPVARVHSLLFLSGAGALMYGVAWARQLGLILGPTVIAKSTVVAVGLLGLALGGFWGGKRADRMSRSELLPDYARLEMMLAFWGALSLWLLSQVGQTSSVDLPGLVGTAVILLPPAIALGATLPLVSRAVLVGREALGEGLAGLWGVYLLGGGLGSAVAGFLMIPLLGLRVTASSAAALHLLIALLAFRMPEVSDGDSGEVESTLNRWYLPVVFLSAAAVAASQAGWARGLVLSLGPSIYPYAMVLTLTLFGLGLGSLCYRAVVLSLDPEQMGWLQFGIGACTIMTVALLGFYPYVMVSLSFKSSSALSILMRFASAAPLLLEATFLTGIVFPLAARLSVGESGAVGRTVGTVYAVAAVGSAFGVFGAGVVGLSLWGAQGVLRFAAYISLGLALMSFLTKRDEATVYRAALVISTALVCWILPAWNPGAVNAGTGIYATMDRLNLSAAGLYIPPTTYRDGPSATVAVHVGPDSQTVRVDGRIEASLQFSDRLAEYFTGYVPGLLQDSPENVLVLGFGSGMTAESLSDFSSLQQLDCVEPEPAVLQAAGYWKGYNGDILAQPKVSVTVNDVRAFLSDSEKKYDVIADRLGCPWTAAEAGLFTREFYQSCRRRLADDGIMCQRVELYGMSRESLALVVRTFFHVFPEGAVWRASSGDILLLGAEVPLEVDMEKLQTRWNAAPKLRRRMLELNLYSPDCLLGHSWLEREDALRFAGPAGLLNTDDAPLLEFLAPLTLYNKDAVQALSDELEFCRSRLLPVEETPARLAAAGIGWLNVERPEMVAKYLTPQSAPLAWARMLEVEKENQAAFEQYPRAEVGSFGWVASYWLANAQSRQGLYQKALSNFSRALQTVPEAMRVNILLDQADCALAAHDPELALESVNMAMAEGSLESRTMLFRGRALYHLGRFEDALHEFEVGCEVNPAGLGFFFGRAHSTLQLGGDPEPIYREIIELSPGFDQPMLELARYQASQGRKDEALETVELLFGYFPYAPSLFKLKERIEGGKITSRDVLE